MARAKRNDIAAKELHKAFLRIKRRHANASPKDVELWAWAQRGVKISDVTIRKVFDGEVDPTACAVELLLVIADFYDAGPGELGDAAEERMSVVSRLHRPGPTETTAAPFPGHDGTGDQGTASSRCTERHLRLA